MKFAVGIVAAMAAYSHAANGILTGRLLNSQSVPVVSARIVVQRDGNAVASLATDERGSFRFALPGGNYVLTVPGVSKTFSIASGKTTTLDIILPESSGQLPFFDEPKFAVAGVTDNTYRGGHGSDGLLRSSETLKQETAGLGEPTEAERAGHYLEAARELQNAAGLDPSEPNLFAWGTELLSHGAHQPAEEVFAKGCSLFPRSIRMQLGLASAWYSAGNYAEAAKSFFAAIDLDPRDPKAYAFLSQAKSLEITQAPGYLERFVNFVQLQPDSALANYYYGSAIWNDKQDFAGSVQAFEKAIALDPHLAGAYLALGSVLAKRSRFSDALDPLRKAVQLMPDSEEAHYRLAEAYRMTGNRVPAAQEMVLYEKLAAESAQNKERERREVRQFVIRLKSSQ